MEISLVLLIFFFAGFTFGILLGFFAFLHCKKTVLRYQELLNKIRSNPSSLDPLILAEPMIIND